MLVNYSILVTEPNFKGLPSNKKDLGRGIQMDIYGAVFFLKACLLINGFNFCWKFVRQIKQMSGKS